MPITGTPLSTLSTDTSSGAGDAGKVVLLDGTGKVDASMLPTPATGDITAVAAGDGLSGGGTSGSVTLDVEIPVPVGGTTGQALVKVSNADGDIDWGTVSGGSAEVVNVIFFANVGSVTNATGAIGDIAIVGGNPDGLWYKNASNVWTYGGPISGYGGTISSVTAGTALSGGGSSGAVTLNVVFATPSSLTVGGSNAAGSNSSAARSDHTHALPAFGSTSGTFMEGNATPTASGLKTATTTVAVSSATAPSSGQVLTATSSTAAQWSTPASASTTVKKAGTTIGTRGAVNFIEGSNVTITTTDNSGSDRVDVTIASSGGGSSNAYLDTPSSPHADNDEFTGWSGWTVRDLVAGTNLIDDGDGSVHPWSFPASGHYRRKTIGSQIVLQFPNSTNSVLIYKAITVSSNMLIWSRVVGTSGFLSGTVDTNTISQLHFGLYTDSGGVPVTTNQLVVEQSSVSGSGRKFGYLEGATRVSSTQIVNQGMKMLDVMGFMHFSSTSFIPFAVDTTSGDVQFFTGNAITATSATRAYVGYRAIVGGSSVYCPFVTIDFFRRKDSSTAWII